MISLVHWFFALLVSRHQAVLGLDDGAALNQDLWVVNFEDNAFGGLSLPHDPIARHPNLWRFRNISRVLCLNILRHLILLLSQLPALQVLLVLFAGRVCKVGSLIHVHRQTKPALERAQMIAHKIRVLTDVGGFRLQLADSLPPNLLEVGGRCKPTHTLSSDAMLPIHI